MNDILWREFFDACATLLGSGTREPRLSSSWCAWTTFDRLATDAGYWTCGLPAASDLREGFIADGGIWGQPFWFVQLAHVIVPARFYWENSLSSRFESGYKSQPIGQLSEHLSQRGVPHRLTELVLEIKLY